MKKNVMGKIALLTLGLIMALIAVFFAFLSVATPGVLAGWCEKTGSYSLAARYASLHYAYTGDVEEAARSAQDAILAEDDGLVIKYGTRFIDHEDFGDYCSECDEYYSVLFRADYSYRQYIYGEIAVSYYSEGDTQSAIGCAIQALCPSYDRSLYATGSKGGYEITGFPDSNALIALSLKVINNSDGGAAEYILDVLESITAEGTQQENLTAFISVMQEVAQGTYTG